MAFGVFCGLVGLGFLCLIIITLSQRAILRRPSAPPPAEWPPVTILKPLKGLDAGLEENLRSVFELDYPQYEILLGAESADDPAIEVARRLVKEYPSRRAIVIHDALAVGYNPKVNNLFNLYRRSSYDLLLISDSNVRVNPGYLKDLVARRAERGGGLAWSLFRGTGEFGAGGVLEALHLNTQVMCGAAALGHIMPCAIGKSMLLDIEDLETVGGFEYLGRFLAEDQILAEEFAKLKLPISISHAPIDNVLGRRTLAEYAGRQLRWSRLRRTMSLPGYAAEILLNPILISLIGFIAMRTLPAAILLGSSIALAAALDALMERAAGVRRPLLAYPLLSLALALARGLIWPLAFVSGRVVWRENILRLGRRSCLTVVGRTPRKPAPIAIKSTSA